MAAFLQTKFHLFLKEWKLLNSERNLIDVYSPIYLDGKATPNAVMADQKVQKLNHGASRGHGG